MLVEQIMRFRSYVCLLAFFGCSAAVELEDNVILEVDGRPGPIREFESYVETALQHETPFMRGELMAALFEEFIEEQLLLRAADDEGLEVEPAAVQRELDAMGSLAEGTVLTGEEEKARLAEKIEKQLKVRRLVQQRILGNLSVSDEEIASHYQGNREEFHQPPVIELSQILLDNAEDAAATRAALLEKPPLFQELARARSLGPEAELGGVLGSFRMGELPPAFEQAVASLRPGRISDVVETEYGFHIFRLDGRSEALELSLEDVSAAIRDELLRRKGEQAMADFLDTLRERYPVKVYRERLNFPFGD